MGARASVWRSTGEGWAKEPFPTHKDGRPPELYEVDALGDTFAVAGERGLVAVRRGPGPWKILPPPGFDSLRTIRLLEDGSLVAGGPLGRIYHWAGDTWRRLDKAESLVDLRAFVGPRDGLPALALGRRETYLGPLLDPPALQRPGAFEPLGSAPAIEWQVSSRPAEGTNMLFFTTATNETRWLVIAPELRSIRLPDLGRLAGAGVIDPREGYMYFHRALLPGFDINHFSFSDLWYRDWRSWVTTKVRLAPD